MGSIRRNRINAIFCALIFGLVILQLATTTARKHHRRQTSEDIGRKNQDKRPRYHKTRSANRQIENEDSTSATDIKTTRRQYTNVKINNTNHKEMDIDYGRSPSHHIVVSTKSGKIRGRVVQVLPDSKIAVFLGIQYGQPPIGGLRFKKSIFAEKWSGIRNAFVYPNSCYQWRDNTFGAGYPGTEMWNANTPLSEDCLYLNIWTPVKITSQSESTLHQDALLPVMVWIYGGGFYSGTSSLDVYDGKWLAATERVVVVSFNYRIAALGFLSFGIDDAPGNAGLWDQNLALQWVKENIHQFGGDPDRVTLFGESAGAASVSMHILSEHSRGLFQNAILESGSALSPWSMVPMHVMKKRAYKLAESVGCSENFVKTISERNEDEMIKNIISCLYTIDPQILVDIEMSMEDLGTARFQNAAVVEWDFFSEEATKSLENGRFATDVNMLVGFNENEGNYFLVYGSPGFNISVESPINYAQYREGLMRGLRVNSRNPEQYKTRNDIIPDLMLNAINFLYTDYEKTLSDQEICSVLGEEYLCSSTTARNGNNDYKAILDHVVGDANFVCPTIDFTRKTLQYQAYPKDNLQIDIDASGNDDKDVLKTKIPKQRGRKYLYQFLHRSSKTPWPKWMGVLHGYEIEFAFGIPLNTFLGYTEEEIELSRRIMRYWTNFAKTGDPNQHPVEVTVKTIPELELPHWPEYTLETESSFVFTTSSPGTQKSDEEMNYVQANTKKKHCTFWRSYYPKMKQHIDAISKQDMSCGTRESRSPQGNSALNLKQFNSFLSSFPLLTLIILKVSEVL